MAKPRNDLIDRLQYVGLRVASMLMHCWPVDLNLKLARIIGDAVYTIDKKHRQRAIYNLKRAFRRCASASRKLARRSMQNLFMFFVEVLFTTRLMRIDTWTRYVQLENFREVLAMLLRRHHGLIMLTGHFGNFEISNYVLGTLGFETTAIGRPLDNRM
jgi:lauroyl/myristoyl acyltransferase